MSVYHFEFSRAVEAKKNLFVRAESVEEAQRIVEDAVYDNCVPEGNNKIFIAHDVLEDTEELDLSVTFKKETEVVPNSASEIRDLEDLDMLYY